MPASTAAGVVRWRLWLVERHRGRVLRQHAAPSHACKAHKVHPKAIVVDLELQQVVDVRLVRLARPPMRKATREEPRGEVDVAGRDHRHLEKGPRLLVVAVKWRERLDGQIEHERVVAGKALAAGAPHLLLELLASRLATFHRRSPSKARGSSGRRHGGEQRLPAARRRAKVWMIEMPAAYGRELRDFRSRSVGLIDSTSGYEADGEEAGVVLLEGVDTLNSSRQSRSAWGEVAMTATRRRRLGGRRSRARAASSPAPSRAENPFSRAHVRHHRFRPGNPHPIEGLRVRHFKIHTITDDNRYATRDTVAALP